MSDKAPTKQEKLKEFEELVDKFDLAMLVTQTEDGSIVSRVMATQERRPGVDVWFVTSTETEKMSDLMMNPDVNVSFLNPSTREWVSVSGTATINEDRDTIRSLYKPDWKIWFQDGGGDDDTKRDSGNSADGKRKSDSNSNNASSSNDTNNSNNNSKNSSGGNGGSRNRSDSDENAKGDGGPDDPRIVLIEVNAHTVHYFKSHDSRPVALFKVAKAFATGKKPEFGDTQEIVK